MDILLNKLRKTQTTQNVLGIRTRAFKGIILADTCLDMVGNDATGLR